MKLAPRILATISGFLVAEVTLFLLLSSVLTESEKALDNEHHARRILYLTQSLANNYVQADKAATHFFLSGDPKAKAKYYQISATATANFQELKEQVENEPEWRNTVSQVIGEVNSVRKITEDAILKRETLGSFAEFKDYANEIADKQSMYYVKKLPDQLNELLSTQQAVLSELPIIQAGYRDSIKNLTIAGLLLNIIAAFSLAWVLVREVTDRLRILVDNTERLSAGLQLNKQLIGNDEIAQLDASFHEMAESLVTAKRKEIAILQNVVDVVVCATPDGIITSVSNSCESMWGYSPVELIGKPLSSLISRDDRVQFRADLFTFDKTERTSSFECRTISKQGQEFYTSWSGQCSDDENSFYCVAHDTTERRQREDLIRQSEERVQTVIARMPVSVLICSVDSTIEYSNSRFEEMTALSNQQIIGRHISNCLPIKSIAPSESIFDQLKSNLNRVVEFLVRAADNRELCLEGTMSELVIFGQTKYLLVFLDTSERHELQRLRQAFVAMVSHDLRTPLTSIRGFFELTLMGAFGEFGDVGMQSAEKALNSTEMLIRFVSDLLDLEKLDTGAMTIEKSKISALALMQTATQAVSFVAAEKEIRLDTEIVSEQLLIWGDADRLIQVLINLVSNAIKFSEKSSAVRISAAVEESFVVFSVTDSGRGIPADMIESIFEKFVQVESRDGMRGKGSGLGLTICKLIVEAHGGQIGVTSEVNQGSRFWFKIDRVDSLTVDT